MKKLITTILAIMSVITYILLGFSIYYVSGTSKPFLDSFMQKVYLLETIILPIIVIIFLFIKYYSFQLFKNKDKSWKYYFYWNYILLIPALGFFEQYGHLVFALFPITSLIFIIEYIFLLIKSYTLKPRLTYFFNLLIPAILIVLLLVWFIFLLASYG